MILLVEDNKDDEELTLLALEEGLANRPVVVARDGAEAIDYLHARGKYSERDPREVPRVVLLDLKLPKLDGLQVLKRLREDARTRHVPVVILTTSKEDEDVRAGYELGANSYVRKPVDFSTFTEAIKTLSRYWTSLNHTT